MNGMGSIFFDINLPNPPTRFYFSVLLAVALFVKFSRLLSIRNLDVLTLFLPMPGLLLILEQPTEPFWGYLALLLASFVLLVRCLVDLTLVRRPALGPNLELGGLAWLGAALFVSLVAVAFRQPQSEPVKTAPGPAAPIKETAERALQLAPPPVAESVLPWVGRSLNLACHLSVVVGLVLIGWKQFEDLRSGMAAATFYLLLPYSYLMLPATHPGLGRWDDPLPMALLVWTVFTYRQPLLAGSFLGVAVGPAPFLVVLLPTWLGFYRKRGSERFLLGFLGAGGLCLAVLGCVHWLNGELPTLLRSTWMGADWLPWRVPAGLARGFWQDLPEAAYRAPIFIAYVALVIITAFWPAPRNLAHVLALSAAVLLGIQFWYADRGGIYVLWYLPFLLLLVFRPNLTNALPPEVPPSRLLVRWADWLLHRTRRWLRIPEPVSIPRETRSPESGQEA
jgi:hypothetical protein